MNIAEKLPYLRIVCNYSDDCNFNCRWCHHEGVYNKAERTLLSPEQIVHVADEFFRAGVRKFKILGGEPTLRRDLDEIIRGLRGIDDKIDISIVTNGHRLKDKIEEYKDAGLTRVNVSLFTLDEQYFKNNIGDICLLRDVIEGIDKAAGMHMISKINHIYHSQEDLQNVLKFAQQRNIRINLLNEIPNYKGGRYTDINTIIDALRDIGIEDSEIENDPFSLPVVVYKLKNNVSVEVKHLTICDQNLFDSCRNCEFTSKCKEGIFALRLTPEGKIRPCLVRTDNQFDVLGKSYDELVQYLCDL